METEDQGAFPERTLHPPLLKCLLREIALTTDKSEITCSSISYGLLTSTILLPTSSSLSEGVRFFGLFTPCLMEDFVRFHISVAIKTCRLVDHLNASPIVIWAKMIGGVLTAHIGQLFLLFRRCCLRLPARHLHRLNIAPRASCSATCRFCSERTRALSARYSAIWAFCPVYFLTYLLPIVKDRGQGISARNSTLSRTGTNVPVFDHSFRLKCVFDRAVFLQDSIHCISNGMFQKVTQVTCGESSMGV